MSPLRVLVVTAWLAIANQVRAQAVFVAGSVDPAGKRTSGFSVHKEDTAVSEGLDEFDRYCSKGAWEKAFTSLAKVTESPAKGLTPRGDGFFVPTRVRLRRQLIALPPEGKQAYRLFNDGKARKLFAELDAPPAQDPDSSQPGRTDELAKLQDLFDQFFITSIGDQIADRLGDASFEVEDFSRAAECWGAILSDFPETSLSPLRLSTKRAIALCRAGRRDECATLVAQVSEKYSGQSVRIGGRDVVASALLEELLNDTSPRTSAPTMVSAPLRLPQSDEPLWQSQLADERLFKEIETQRNNMGWGMYAGQLMAVPSAAADEHRVYVNLCGVGMAIDAETGKLLWRTDSLTKLPQKFQQMMQQGVPSELDDDIAVAPQAGCVVIIGNPSGQPQGPCSMRCLAAETGKVIWSSERGVLASWSFAGAPLIDGETIYATARSNSSMELSLLSIGLGDGKLLWNIPLGAMSAGQDFRGMPRVSRPALLRSRSMLFVLTSNGALLAVSPTARRVEWAFVYDTPAPQNQQYYYYQRAREAPQFPAGIQLVGNTLYIKDKNNDTAYAIDLNGSAGGGPALRWRRPVDSNATIVAADESSLLMLSEEIDAIDPGTREMRWSAKTPIDTGDAQALVAGGHVYLYGSRGVYDIDGRSGERAIFRGYDHDGVGGVVLRVGDRLVCVSNRAVTAYPLQPSEPSP